MILYINTKDQKQVTVSLKNNDQVLDSITEYNNFGSQVLLPVIKKILDKNNIKFSDLKQIEVENGPGSYTGLKVGVAVANALGFALNIPVNGKDMEIDLIY